MQTLKKEISVILWCILAAIQTQEDDPRNYWFVAASLSTVANVTIWGCYVDPVLLLYIALSGSPHCTISATVSNDYSPTHNGWVMLMEAEGEVHWYVGRDCVGGYGCKHINCLKTRQENPAEANTKSTTATYLLSSVGPKWENAIDKWFIKTLKYHWPVVFIDLKHL